MSYNQGNTGFKVGTTGFSATGLSLIAAANAGAARSALGLDTSNQPVFAGLTVTGNLTVNGTQTTVNGETTVFADNFINLNSGYTADGAQEVGFVANYDPTTTVDTVAGSYVAANPGTTNATVVTTGSATFAQGDIIQLSGGKNDGLYEVDDHTGTTLTIRGQGAGGHQTTDKFFQGDFVANTTDGCAITKINVSVLRAGTDGVWETAKGAATPLTYTDIIAPVAGNGLTLTGATLDVGAGDGIQSDANSITVKLDGASLAKSGSGLKVDTTQAFAFAGRLTANGGFSIATHVTSTDYTVATSDVYVGVTDTSGVRTITLYAASGHGGDVVIVKDESGGAGTNNIVVDGNASENIDGATTHSITSNWGSLTLKCDGAQWFVI